ncbi:hypothetical protein R6Q57_014266 [Mikania cordata]
MAEIDEQIQIPSHKHKKMFIGVDWNRAGELKLMLSAVLFLCSIITLFQFFPSSVNPDLRHCTAASPPSFVTSPPPVQNKKLEDQVVGDGFVKRSFNGYGTAAYNFILMSAYRGGADTFAVIGLSSKPLHLFSKPSYICQWIPHPATGNNENITVTGYRFMKKWMFFFDLDEFLSVPKETTIKNVTDSLLGYTQFTIEQRTMSSNL